jgi:hypothetical protein
MKCFNIWLLLTRSLIHLTMKLIDITGQRFGRLLVLHKGSVSKTGGSIWICRCECGNEATANASNLRNGSTLSCRCLRKETSQQLGSNPAFIKIRSAKLTVHGHKKRGAMTPEYRTWLGMKRRCQDENYKDFPNWGGRGITVCERWDRSFVDFLSDMGARPSDDHSIDRINPNGNYEPGNCRWATATEQGGEHRRDLIVVEVDGMRFESLKSACQHFGMPYTAVFERIKSGMPLETALTTKKGALPNTRSRESYLRKDKC